MMPEKSTAAVAQRIEQRIELGRLRRRAASPRRTAARLPVPASDPSASAPRQSPAGSRDWRARRAPGPAPGSRSSATSTGRMRSRRRRTAPGATGRAFRPARRLRRRRSSRRRGSCCCRSLPPGRRRRRRNGRCARPSACRTGSALAKASFEPPAMKVSVPAAAPPVPPETGASIDSRPCLPAIAWALRAEFDIDGRAVDEQRALRGLRRDVLIDRQDMLAGRQHGDDDLGVLDRRDAVGHDHDAIVRAPFQGSPATRSKPCTAMPGLDQIGGHRVAHIAEADEGDRGHAVSPDMFWFSARSARAR